MVLPVNIDATYSDDASNPGKQAHQQHHDTLHAFHNTWEGIDPADKADLADVLPLAGGTMTGDLVLAGDPSAALEAATKQYVDGLVGVVSSARATRTSGTVTINSTTWTNFDTGLDLTLTGVEAGDIIEVGVIGAWSSAAVDGFLDAASLVAGSPVNYWSGNNGGASSVGVPAWWGPSGIAGPIGGTIQRAVVSGDLSAGSLTLRLRARTGTASNKALGASSDQPFHWHAKNLGH